MSDRPDTILLYGSTDVGKTSQLGELAKWHFERTGEISRLVSADSGWDPIGDLIISAENPSGIIEAWNVQSLQDPWLPLVELSEGSWPRMVANPNPPGGWKAIMVRPVLKDGRIFSSGKKVGQILMEGLSTLGNTALQDHVRNRRPMWGAGKESGTEFTSKSVEETTGKNPENREMIFGRAVGGHFGSVQNFLLEDLVPRFGNLRSVARVVWTAHESRGKDELTGIEKAVLGPATVGQAAVDRTPQKFGHTFHLTVNTKFTTKGEVIREFKAWFVKHPDEVLTKMEWPAKLSLPITKSKELLSKFPGGFIPLDNGSSMSQFLEFLHPRIYADKLKVV